jgi:hypothetical protein
VIIEWHDIAEPKKLVKCDFLDLKNYQTTCSCCQVQVSNREEKFDTGIESLSLIRIPSLCNTFTSTTLSKMIRFWICKDQNDSLHTAHHAEPLVGHIWSHFDWHFQSRRDQTPEFAFGVQSKHLFKYHAPKSKNGKPNLLYVVKDLWIHMKKIILDF